MPGKKTTARSCLRNPAPWKQTGPSKLALTRPMASLSHRMGEGRGEGARFTSPSLFQPRRRITISVPAYSPVINCTGPSKPEGMSGVSLVSLRMFVRVKR